MGCCKKSKDISEKKLAHLYNIETITYKNHQYIMCSPDVIGEFSSSIVHDPDCVNEKCNK